MQRIGILMSEFDARVNRYVALKCCDRLAGACNCWANNVRICSVEMLLSFSRGLSVDGARLIRL